MKNWFYSLAVSLIGTVSLFAQGIITGTIVESDTNMFLPGANVLIKGTSQGVSTDFDGNFTLSVPSNSGVLTISYMGYETKQVPYTLTGGKLYIKVVLTPDAHSLGEVVVTGGQLLDIAKDRQTPVAVSTIKASEISEKLGSREFPEILNRTPSVYATKSGGGFGDSRINIRGFEQENIAVMVNGMPVNDMENGKVYWSNWAGVSDVTSAMQVQRGLGSSKLAIASVGGTINIVTRAADMREGGVIAGSIGNDDYHKTLAMYSTGKSEKGWSASVLLSRTGGSTYADATKFEGYNYFLAFGYNPSEKHALQFMMTGAPQWHNQRSASVRISDAIKYGGEQDKPNRRYNSDWGYLNGEEFSNKRNGFHKPVMMLNWDWTISERSTLNTVAYASFGRGFGTGDLGSVGGKQLRDFRNSTTGLYDFDAIVADNQDATKTGSLIRRAGVNSHDWYGFLTNFGQKLSDKLTLNIGLDGRYYYGYHHQVVSDFLGASSYSDSSNKNLAGANVVTASISDKPSFNPFASVSPMQEQIAYSNDGEVLWTGAFGQLEYTSNKFSAFAQGSVSNQGFQRIDEFVKPGTLAVANNPATAMERKTGFKNLLGYNVKVGANFNINENHNIFANTGYYSKQPFFNAVYPGNKNYLNPNLTNEKIIGVELGYGYRSSMFNANVNLYRTQWSDRFLRKSHQIGQDSGFYANIEGIKEVHQGVEIDADLRVADFLKFQVMLSVGDWFYEGNAEGAIYNESNELVDAAGNVITGGAVSDNKKLYLDKVKVGNSAQTTASIGATLTPIERLNFDASYRYVDRLYATLNLSNFDTEAKQAQGALQLPGYGLVDLGLSYKLPLVGKQSITFSGHVNNLLDTYYISDSYDNTHAKTLSDFTDNATATAQQQYETYQANNLYKGIDTSNRVYFGFGRTWNFGIRYIF